MRRQYQQISSGDEAAKTAPQSPLQGRFRQRRAVGLTLCLLVSAVCVLLVALSVFEAENELFTDNFLAPWALIALLGWALSAALLASVGGLPEPRLVGVFTLLCFLGSLLSFLCFVAYLVAIPAATLAAVAHLCVVGFIATIWAIFRSVEVEHDRVWPGILSFFLMAAVILLAVGMAAQSIEFATRYRSDVLMTTLDMPFNGTDVHLFVNCSGAVPQNASVIVLVVPELDHTTVFYLPLQQVLIQNFGFIVCLYDTAGVGFSSSGPLPRSASMLGAEAAFVAQYVSSLYAQGNSSQSFVALGCGQAALTIRHMLQEPGMQDLFNGGLVLLDGLTEFDPEILGGALGMSASDYISYVTAPLLSSFQLQHLTAGMGSCLLNVVPYRNRYPPLPGPLEGLQLRSRCNGGMRPMASLSASSWLYRDLVNGTLGSTPLLVLVSGGPLSGDDAWSRALSQVQELLYGLSSSSSIQIIADSKILGDLVVLQLDQVNQAIVNFVAAN